MTQSTGYPSIDRPWLKYYPEEAINATLPRCTIRHDGFKVFPSQIEQCVNRNTSVEACCAVGVRDAEHSQGMLPAVFAVLKPGSDKARVKSELRSVCARELPEYAQPVRYRFIGELPLTPIGKVDYRALEKMMAE